MKRALIYISLLILLTGCQTDKEIRSEKVINEIKFTIQGTTRPVSSLDKKEGVLQLKGEIEVAAIGDIIPHQNVKRCAEQHREDEGKVYKNEGYDYLFERVRDELKADITIANYESPIASPESSLERPFVFNSPVSLLRAAAEANINIFNIANNHIYDQGIKGFNDTLKSFRDNKISYIGTYKNNRPVPFTYEKNGIRVAIFGFTTLMNSMINYDKLDEFVRKYDEKIDPEAIRGVREQYDVIIIYIHWGEEYIKEPSKAQREIALQLIDAGADIIIGGHPHILQPLELMVSEDKRVVPVIFSLGNFISNQSRNYYYPISGVDEGRTRDSAILKFRIKGYSFDKMNFSVISDLHFIPLWTQNNNLFYVRGIDKKIEIYVFRINDRIEQLKDVLEKEKDDKRRKELLLELENLYLRLNVIKETLGADFVR